MQRQLGTLPVSITTPELTLGTFELYGRVVIFDGAVDVFGLDLSDGGLHLHHVAVRKADKANGDLSKDIELSSNGMLFRKSENYREE